MHHFVVVTDEGDLFQVGSTPNMDYILVDPRFTVLELEHPFENNPTEFYYDYVDAEIKPRAYPESPPVVEFVYWMAYDPTTGSVISSGQCMSNSAPPVVDGCDILYIPAPTSLSPSAYYFDITNLSLELRPELPVNISKAEFKADNIDSAILSNLPQPVTVKINGEQTIVVEDGELILRSAMPARYFLEIDHWPYLPWSTTFEATL